MGSIRQSVDSSQRGAPVPNHRRRCRSRKQSLERLRPSSDQGIIPAEREPVIRPGNHEASTRKGNASKRRRRADIVTDQHPGELAHKDRTNVFSQSARGRWAADTMAVVDPWRRVIGIGGDACLDHGGYNNRQHECADGHDWPEGQMIKGDARALSSVAA